jgi:hypothetical protein
VLRNKILEFQSTMNVQVMKTRNRDYNNIPLQKFVYQD